jgi:hypothetical protein
MPAAMKPRIDIFSQAHPEQDPSYELVIQRRVPNEESNVYFVYDYRIRFAWTMINF